jgi:hypothetical protein
LDVVLKNVRRLVQAKNELGATLPYLSWRMLTFEHNIHEVNTAIDLARDMGVNEIEICTPFDVSLDDPLVHAAESDRRGTHVFIPFQARSPQEWPLTRLPRYPTVEGAFETNWVDRGGELSEPSNSSSATCLWLYWSMTVDGAQRIMPCCMAPSDTKNLVYGSMAAHPAEPFNLDGFRLSRLSFSDRDAFNRKAQDISEGNLPFCSDCQERPTLTYPVDTAVQDIQALDCLCIFPRNESVLRALADWSYPMSSQELAAVVEYPPAAKVSG